MKPLISVIVPVYNTAKYLDKCLESILQQSMREIEIICVDDCSFDGSYLIVEKYKKQDERIKLIRHNENKGSGGARNTGIIAAKANFIASVDSDDTMLPNMIQALWDECENGKFDIVDCGFYLVDEEGRRLSKRRYAHQVIANNQDNNVDIFSLLSSNFWNKLWRKSLFLENQIFFPEGIYYEDLATIPRLLAKSKNIKIIDKCLYNYLIREGSITNSYSQKHIDDYFKVFSILKNFLVNQNMFEGYRTTFESVVHNNIYYHTRHILSLEMDDYKLSRYLDRLLTLKSEYLNIKKPSVSGNISELTLALMPRSQLTSPQRIGSDVFAFLLKYSMTSRQQVKLKENPKAFFSDSKNSFTRAFGRFIKLC